ncbi:MAG TPA: pitrilysin family protein [Thermoanaerobaculia bacterium]|nr:pitrilysin family protein [Thermoanaerobaculia bacterium]
MSENVLYGAVQHRTLANGLEVAAFATGRVPLVSTVLWYRAGAAAEERSRGGSAHFLEHMMFKGSARYGPGEVDRLTQKLGGANNAFTGHDSTAYYFQFASDCWEHALDIEVDRMRGLRLEAREVDHERDVILEEIAMYESDPWDALERRVQALLHGDHPYGRSVLGTPAELNSLGAEELLAFQREFYSPANAVLVIAGDVGEEALDVAERRFGDLPSSAPPPRRPGGPAPRGRQRRLVRRHGEVPRLLWSVVAPAWSDPRHPALRILTQLLTEGKSSLLHRALVEEGQLCSWVAADLAASLDPGALSIAAELLPGIEPDRVEEELFRLLGCILEGGFAVEDLERARRTYEADWIFGHERVHQRALTLASALAYFDADFPRRYLDHVLEADLDQVLDAGRETLRRDSGVVGWSLPESEAA